MLVKGDPQADGTCNSYIADMENLEISISDSQSCQLIIRTYQFEGQNLVRDFSVEYAEGISLDATLTESFLPRPSLLHLESSKCLILKQLTPEKLLKLLEDYLLPRRHLSKALALSDENFKQVWNLPPEQWRLE